MPLLCLPVGAKPFQIVIGEGIVATDDENARKFALARTMKLCAARCASLIRVPSSDLRMYVDALLHHLHPEHPAPPMEADKLDEVTKRLQRFIPRQPRMQRPSAKRALSPGARMEIPFFPRFARRNAKPLRQVFGRKIARDCKIGILLIRLRHNKILSRVLLPFPFGLHPLLRVVRERG